MGINHEAAKYHQDASIIKSMHRADLNSSSHRYLAETNDGLDWKSTVVAPRGTRNMSKQMPYPVEDVKKGRIPDFQLEFPLPRLTLAVACWSLPVPGSLSHDLVLVLNLQLGYSSNYRKISWVIQSYTT